MKRCYLSRYSYNISSWCLIKASGEIDIIGYAGCFVDYTENLAIRSNGRSYHYIIMLSKLLWLNLGGYISFIGVLLTEILWYHIPFTQPLTNQLAISYLGSHVWSSSYWNEVQNPETGMPNPIQTSLSAVVTVSFCSRCGFYNFGVAVYWRTVLRPSLT